MDDKSKVWLYINHKEIEVPVSIFDGIPSTGNCYEQVANSYDRNKDYFSSLSDNDLIEHLKEFGAWNDHELQDRRTNIERVIWVSHGSYIDGYL